MAAVGFVCGWWSEYSQVQLLAQIYLNLGLNVEKRPDRNFTANAGGGGDASVSVNAGDAAGVAGRFV